MEHKIYRQNLKIEAEAAVAKMVGEKVPEGYILEVTEMSITNISEHDDNLEIGYIDLGGVDRTVCINNGAAMHHHHLTGRLFLMAGEQPFGRVTTPGDGNDLYFNCHGKLWPVE